MSYESRVFIVLRHELNNPITDEPYVNALPVAEFDLCCMGRDNEKFFDAFKTEVDFDLYLPGFDADENEVILPTRTDCYDEHLKYATLEDLLAALKSSERREHYRRLPPLIAALKAFIASKDEWGDRGGELIAVHYGY